MACMIFIEFYSIYRTLPIPRKVEPRLLCFLYFDIFLCKNNNNSININSNKDSLNTAEGLSIVFFIILYAMRSFVMRGRVFHNNTTMHAEQYQIC